MSQIQKSFHSQTPNGELSETDIRIFKVLANPECSDFTNLNSKTIREKLQEMANPDHSSDNSTMKKEALTSVAEVKEEEETPVPPAENEQIKSNQQHQQQQHLLNEYASETPSVSTFTIPPALARQQHTTTSTSPPSLGVGVGVGGGTILNQSQQQQQQQQKSIPPFSQMVQMQMQYSNSSNSPSRQSSAASSPNTMLYQQQQQQQQQVLPVYPPFSASQSQSKTNSPQRMSSTSTSTMFQEMVKNAYQSQKMNSQPSSQSNTPFGSNTFQPVSVPMASAIPIVSPARKPAPVATPIMNQTHSQSNTPNFGFYNPYPSPPPPQQQQPPQQQNQQQQQQNSSPFSASFPPPPLDERYLRQQKQIALLELKKIDPEKLTRKFTMDDDLEDILTEIEGHTKMVESSSMLSMVKEISKFGVFGIVKLNYMMGKPLHIDREWAISMSGDKISKLDAPLEKIIKKFIKRSSMNPFVQLFFALIGSIVAYDIKVRVMGGNKKPKGGYNPNPNHPKSNGTSSSSSNTHHSVHNNREPPVAQQPQPKVYASGVRRTPVSFATSNTTQPPAIEQTPQPPSIPSSSQSNALLNEIMGSN